MAGGEDVWRPDGGHGFHPTRVKPLLIGNRFSSSFGFLSLDEKGRSV